MAVRDKSGTYQFSTASSYYYQMHTKIPLNGSVRIIAQPFRITNCDQKQIQGKRVGAQAANVLIPYQTLIDPTELRGNKAQTIGAKNAFYYHFDYLLLLVFQGNLPECLALKL
jgi:hypothetical protein